MIKLQGFFLNIVMALNGKSAWQTEQVSDSEITGMWWKSIQNLQRYYGVVISRIYETNARAR